MRMSRRMGLLGGGGAIDVSSLPITYTGAMTDEIVAMGDSQYRLLTLTTDGALSIAQKIKADIWICGGGSNGNGSNGGAGAYCSTALEQSISNIAVVIGPANTASGTIIGGDISLDAAGVADSSNGGTGGGGGSTAGTGDGLSKIPFDADDYFQPHCAGGGGGVEQSGPATRYRNGGNGGSNGSNGESGSGFATSANATGGTGGELGGGDGGKYSSSGSDATFYGSGGGGAAIVTGSGYQGVCYVRIPLNQ